MAFQRLPATAATCGDGVWAPGLEACDSGASGSEGCSPSCEVLDFLAVAPPAVDVRRLLGGGAHPLAMGREQGAVVLLELPTRVASADEEAGGLAVESLPRVLMSNFTSQAQRGAAIDLSLDSLPSDEAQPVIAALPDGEFAVAWADLDGDGDELGVRLVKVDASGEAFDRDFANQGVAFSQSSADLAWLGEELVAVWVDDSNAATGPDLRLRAFDADLRPLGDELTLANTEAIEGQPWLSRFGASWLASWRASSVDEPSERIAVASGLGQSWSIEGVGPTSADNFAPVVQLDLDHALVFFADAQALSEDGLTALPELRFAVLDAEAPGEVESCAFPLTHPELDDTLLGQPSLSASGGEIYFAWRASRQLVEGEQDDREEEVWLRRAEWPSGGTDCGDLMFDAEQSLPAGSTERAGDQRFPAVALGNGGLSAAWEDLGQSLSGDQASRDIVLQVTPTLPQCSVSAPCGAGEGNCESDEECEGALKCGTDNGDEVGMPGANVCIPCGDFIVDPGEDCDEGGVDTSTCRANCKAPICGDGILDPGLGEECDEVSASCTSNCMLSVCGDGVVNAPYEECDPGSEGSNSASCDLDCTAPACGDGVLNDLAGEACELDNPDCLPDCSALQNPGCDATGCLTARVRMSELNQFDSNISVRPAVFNGTGSPVDLDDITIRYWFTGGGNEWFAECDWNCWALNGVTFVDLDPELSGANMYAEISMWPTVNPGQVSVAPQLRFRRTNYWGNNESNDYSFVNSLSYIDAPNVTLHGAGGVLLWGSEPPPLSVCGDGNPEPGEECDTGGQSASCDADCTVPMCGDGVVNTQAGEACEPSLDPDCLSDCSGFTVSCTNSSSCLHVQYFHPNWDPSGDNTAYLNLMLVNSGDSYVQLSQVTMRYWFTRDGLGDHAFDCDWAALDCLNIWDSFVAMGSGVSGADAYIEFGFTGATGGLNPGQSTGGIVGRIHATSWQNMNESNDYSRVSNIDSFAPTPSITLYQGGSVIWGTEP